MGGNLNQVHLGLAPTPTVPFQQAPQGDNSTGLYNPLQHVKEIIEPQKTSLPVKIYNPQRQTTNKKNPMGSFRGKSQGNTVRERGRNNSPFALNNDLDLFGNRKNETRNRETNSSLPHARENNSQYNNQFNNRNSGYNQMGNTENRDWGFNAGGPFKSGGK